MQRTGTEVLTEFHSRLARDIREDLSGVRAFEQSNELTPYFYTYYANWIAEGLRLRRTRNAALVRRSVIPGFVDRLRADSGRHPRVLDVGCGYGSDTLLLTMLGCDVTAIDSAPEQPLVAQHRAAEWRDFLGADSVVPRYETRGIERLDAQPASFDGIFTSECLHHIEPVENPLLAIRGLVRPEGRVLVLESNGACLANHLLLARLRQGPLRRLMEEDGQYWLYGDENIRTPRTWKRLFRDCGFSLQQVTYSRHLLSELIGGSPTLDRLLCRLPGKSLLAIHVAFELAPVSSQPL